jgi:hypothetical protein
VRLALEGTLQRHAEVRTSTDGRTHLVVQIVQPRDGLPFVAMFHAGDDAIAGDIRHFAPLMQAGSPVRALGCGLALSKYEGQPALQLKHCSALEVTGIASFVHHNAPSET